MIDVQMIMILVAQVSPSNMHTDVWKIILNSRFGFVPYIEVLCPPSKQAKSRESEHANTKNEQEFETYSTFIHALVIWF